MTTSTKVILGIVGGVALACVAFVASIYTGLTYVSYNTEKGNAQAARVYAAGADYGKTTDNEGCLKKTETIDGELVAYRDYPGMFVRECLLESRPTPNFCDGVPALFSDLDWEEQTCQRLGRPTELCRAAYAGKLFHCDRLRKKQPST